MSLHSEVAEQQQVGSREVRREWHESCLPIRAGIQKKMALNTTMKSMKMTATSRKTMHRMVRLCF